MLSPGARNGAFGDQKGPSIELLVGATPDSEKCLWAISSTRLARQMPTDQLRSTNLSSPMMSEIRCISWRFLSDVKYM